MSESERPSEADRVRWAKWDDLRARQAAATTEEEHEALRQEEEELRDASTDELLTEDMKKPEVWWWLSFASEKGFLGVVIMHGGGMAEAVQNAWSMNLNPGGEVQGVPIPEEHVPEAKYRRRLLSRAELKEAGLA